MQISGHAYNIPECTSGQPAVSRFTEYLTPLLITAGRCVFDVRIVSWPIPGGNISPHGRDCPSQVLAALFSCAGLLEESRYRWAASLSPSAVPFRFRCGRWILAFPPLINSPTARPTPPTMARVANVLNICPLLTNNRDPGDYTGLPHPGTKVTHSRFPLDSLPFHVQPRPYSSWSCSVHLARSRTQPPAAAPSRRLAISNPLASWGAAVK